jgi:hypothetical protein
MDIAGAKALKKRLGANAGEDAPRTSASVPDDAPPVYHYLGVSETPPDTPSAAPEEAPPERRRSFLRRLAARRY